MNRSLVTAIVEHHDPGSTVTSVERTAAGHRPTAVVRFAARSPLVVQLSDDIERVRTEAALVEAVRTHTEVPVPATRSTGRLRDRSYAITEFRPGRNLHAAFVDLSPDRRRTVTRQFGRFLGQLHAAFAFDGYGQLVRPTDGDGLVAPEATRGRWLTRYGRRAVDRLPAPFDALRTRLRACLDRPTDRTVTPRLFPWDLRPGNALLSGGSVSAVLDWERPMAAPPALALAKTEYLVADWYVDEPAPLRRAVRVGYDSVRLPPAVRPVHLVVAIADSAVDSAGVVTNPGYPERDPAASVAFHRSALRAALADAV